MSHSWPHSLYDMIFQWWSSTCNSDSNVFRTWIFSQIVESARWGMLYRNVWLKSSCFPGSLIKSYDVPYSCSLPTIVHVLDFWVLATTKKECSQKTKKVSIFQYLKPKREMIQIKKFKKIQVGVPETIDDVDKLFQRSSILSVCNHRTKTQ